MTTTTNEPQTATFQAAVDNVWFENIRNASNIQSSWNSRNRSTHLDRWDYIVDLEREIAWALGLRELKYEIGI